MRIADLVIGDQVAVAVRSFGGKESCLSEVIYKGERTLRPIKIFDVD